MSTHNIGFYDDLTKIIFEISSNTHLITSAERLAKRLKFLTKIFTTKVSIRLHRCAH